MADFFTTDPQQISRRLAAAFDAASVDGRLLFPDHQRPGTPGYNLRNLILQEVTHWHREANQAFNAMSPQTAIGVYLDRWADFFQQPRSGLRYARGEVTITSKLTGEHLERLFETRMLPEGTELRDGDETFVLLADTYIPEDSRSVTAAIQASVAGPSVRLAAGQPLTVEFGKLRSVLSATVRTEIAGGSYEENDQQLRYRLVHALIDPGTWEGYRTALLSHPDVSEAQLSSGVYGPGTVEAFVVPSLSLPTTTLRDELEAVWRGAGSVYVTFPDYEGVQMQIRLTGRDDADMVTDYINNLAIGETLVLNAIETLLQNAGAADAQVIALRRGSIDLDGQIIDTRTPRQITNLTPETPRSKWHTRPEWITFCEP